MLKYCKKCKSTCIPKVVNRLYIVWTLAKSKFRAGNVFEHSRRMCCIVSGRRKICIPTVAPPVRMSKF